MRGKFSFLCVDIWFDVTNVDLFKKTAVEHVVCLFTYFCDGHKYYLRL